MVLPFPNFPSGNQSDEEDKNISKSLLLLAPALESSDTSKKMSDSKLQKHLFDSAKQLKLKELKYDSNPVCIDASSSHSTING